MTEEQEIKARHKYQHLFDPYDQLSGWFVADLITPTCAELGLNRDSIETIATAIGEYIGGGMWAGEAFERALNEEMARLQSRGRYYVRSCIVEAYQLPDGKWKVYGPNWLKEATFEDEDFHKNFVQI